MSNIVLKRGAKSKTACSFKLSLGLGEDLFPDSNVRFNIMKILNLRLDSMSPDVRRLAKENVRLYNQVWAGARLKSSQDVHLISSV